MTERADDRAQADDADRVAVLRDGQMVKTAAQHQPRGLVGGQLGCGRDGRRAHPCPDTSLAWMDPVGDCPHHVARGQDSGQPPGTRPRGRSRRRPPRASRPARRACPREPLRGSAATSRRRHAARQLRGDPSSTHCCPGCNVGAANHEHGPPALVEHGSRDAAKQHAGNRPVAAGTDHDQIGVDRVGEGDDFVRRIS